MSRSTFRAALVLVALMAGAAQASSGDATDPRPRDWRGGNRFCTNCQPTTDAPASRVAAESKAATKLVAPNTCADPGQSAWFAEEQDHLTAFLNSTATQFK